MATLVLGAVGASLFPSAAGAFSFGAFAFGIAGGLVDNFLLFPLLFPPPDQRGPRLDGLNISSGNEGTPMNWSLGPRCRVGAAIIWASELEEVENKQKVGKGGGGSSYTYEYYISLAICFGDATPQTVSAVRRIFADFKPIYEDRELPKYDAIAIYDGSQTTPDPYLESVMGEGRVPAYKDQILVVIQRLYLGDYGNRVPNLGALIEQDSDLSLAEAIGYILDRAGFDSEDYDTSGVSYCVRGVNFSGVVTTGQCLETALGTYAVNAQEIDGQLVFYDRGIEVPIVVDEADLAFIRAPGISFEEEDTMTLPDEVSVTYVSDDLDQQPGAVQYRDPNIAGGPFNQLRFDTPFVLSSEEAYTIARRLYWQSRGERRKAVFALPSKYLHLCAGDVLDLSRDGQPLSLLVSRVTYGTNGMVDVECVQTWLPLYNQTGFSDNAGYNTDDGYVPPDLRFYIADLPALRDQHSEAVTVIWGAQSLDPDDRFNWCDLWVSLDGTNFERASSVGRSAVIGETRSSLGDGSDLLWDDAGYVEVYMENGDTLSSTTDALVLSGSENIGAIETPDGWEIFGFATVTALGENQYKLTRLLRGLRGTDDVMARHLGRGARFVLLTAGAARIGIWPSGVEYVGRVYAKHVAAGEDPAAIDARVYHMTGESMRPLSPRNLRWSIVTNGSSDQDLVIEWNRRSKLRFDPFGSAAPMSPDESPERYRVIVRYGGSSSSVLREEVVSEPRFVYTQAKRDADAAGGIAWNAYDSFTVFVSQISTVVGYSPASKLFVPDRS